MTVRKLRRRHNMLRTNTRRHNDAHETKQAQDRDDHADGVGVHDVSIRMVTDLENIVCFFVLRRTYFWCTVARDEQNTCVSRRLA